MRILFPAVAALTLASLRFVSAADFTVTNANSSGPGSLFQAITDANADGAQDTILFNIPGPGVQVINVGSTPLPELTSPVLIEGYSQPGSRPNTLAVGNNAVILIQLHGPGVSSSQRGLVVKGGNTRIRGLAITNFYSAIFLVSPLGGNVIQGNFIGVSPSGQTAFANDYGIIVQSAETTVGGSAPEERNVISGNRYDGIYIGGEPALIAGNYIGTDATGTKAIPNATGIRMVNGTASSQRLIGGSNRASANVISGNGTGIRIGEWGVAHFLYSNPAHYVTVAGNLIGTAADGRSPLGNTAGGIDIPDSDNNTIGGFDPASGNTIAFNGMSGVKVYSVRSNTATGNRLLSNRIYGHGSRGIALTPGLGGEIPAPNDPKDVDTGPNNLQNCPMLTSASIANGTATINGTLNSTPNTQFTIQFFADSRNLADPVQTYLGRTSVTTDANGDAAYSTKLPIGDGNVFINATATSAGGDTSEFFYSPGRLVNISTRLQVKAGDNVLIAGFVLERNTAYLVLRALGPSLNINGTPIAGTLQDPILDLYDSKGKLLAENDNWRDDSRSSFGSLAPTNDSESALNASLSPGAYTLVVRGKNGTTGIAIVEAYVDANLSYPELANISTRGLVETGDNVMIGGFIVTESNGPTRFLIRAIGPSLRDFAISNPLADPTLALHDGNGAVIATNDNWKEGDEAAVVTTGLAPLGDAESVIFATLLPGAYTAIVRGKGNATGVALVEVYNLR